MSVQTLTDPKPPRMRPWLRILLGASLALNLLVAGLVIGAAFRFGRPDHGAHPPPPIGAMLFRELPRQDRRALRDRAIDPRPDREARRRADAEAIDTALRATPFDPAAIERFLSEQAQRRHDKERRLHRAWLARVTAMTDADRAAYADRLRQAMQDPHGGRFGTHHRPRD